MKEYFYKCFDCGKTYNKDEIEKNLIYLCPSCGKIEKNQPLRGVLLIEYDYESIKKKYKKKEFLKLQPGRFWQYNFLWPLDLKNPSISSLLQNDIERLSLPSNCLLKYSFEGNNFFVLDDTRNRNICKNILS